MQKHQKQASSGVTQLNAALSNLRVGDNVIWYDDAGSLAYVFCVNFIKASLEEDCPLIYLSFDRSPSQIMDKLGKIAENPRLTIIDCFTYGKGGGSEVFLKFYDKEPEKHACRFVPIKNPHDKDVVMEACYGEMLSGEENYRLVFESLTGMDELWNDEEMVLSMYARACPRLYEMNTIAYWIIEKQAHSQYIKAHINKIAQVVIDLSIKRGKTYLTVLKADNRTIRSHNQPLNYWNKGTNIFFESEKKTGGRIDIGTRLKELRTRQGLSQTELSRLVGVTSSTISQVESNLIYPSLPALLKMAEVLSVDAGSFFQNTGNRDNNVVLTEKVDVQLPNLPKNQVDVKLITPFEFKSKTEAYLIEIPGGTTIPTHFFTHKGEEMGHVLSGEVSFKVNTSEYAAQKGDTIYLISEMPSQWKNLGEETASILWINIR